MVRHFVCGFTCRPYRAVKLIIFLYFLMEKRSSSLSNEQHDLFYNLCIICQKGSSEKLVENPNSCERVLNCIEEWARYRDLEYTEA